MNKRQAKKRRKFKEMCICSFCSSYKEAKQLEREYHEYVVSAKRHDAYAKEHNYVNDYPFM